MNVVRSETLVLQVSDDVVRARHLARTWMAEMRFSLLDQTKMVTAVSELARNTVEHGRGGSARAEALEAGPRRGIRLVFQDQGPGIPDLELALRDGYSTGGGLGLGLSGSRRLVNEFDIWSAPGEGTRVTVVKWA